MTVAATMEGTMNMYYRLNESGDAEPCSAEEWSAFFCGTDRHLAKDYVTGPDGQPVFVSTVFLGLDHGFVAGLGPEHERLPVLWETMIFHGSWSGEYCERYKSKEEALEGHAKALAVAKQWTSSQKS